MIVGQFILLSPFVGSGIAHRSHWDRILGKVVVVLRFCSTDTECHPLRGLVSVPLVAVEVVGAFVAADDALLIPLVVEH